MASFGSSPPVWTGRWRIPAWRSSRTLTRPQSSPACGQFTVTGARVDTLMPASTAGDGTLGKFDTDSGDVYASASCAVLKALVDELKKNPGKIPIKVKIF